MEQTKEIKTAIKSLVVAKTQLTKEYKSRPNGNVNSTIVAIDIEIMNLERVY